MPPSQDKWSLAMIVVLAVIAMIMVSGGAPLLILLVTRPQSSSLSEELVRMFMKTWDQGIQHLFTLIAGIGIAKGIGGNRKDR